MLGALDGHREGDDGVDLVVGLGLVEAPAAAGDLPRDGLRDVPVEVGVRRVPQALLHDG